MVGQQRAINLDTPARRGAVDRLLGAADKITNQTAALAEIRELHERETTLCINCSERWPCSTIAILERHGL
jgi:hypothetical protein